MRVRKCVCMYVYIDCMHLCIHMHVSCVCEYKRILSMCTHVLYICIYIYVRVCVCVLAYVCVYDSRNKRIQTHMYLSIYAC